MRQGLAFCSEDRKREGLVAASFRARELDSGDAGQSRRRLRLLPRKEQERLTEHYIRALKIKTPERRDADPKSVRRQPAKSAARPLARGATEVDHPG